jgi:hypothetical protein
MSDEPINRRYHADISVEPPRCDRCCEAAIDRAGAWVCPACGNPVAAGLASTGAKTASRPATARRDLD